MVVVHNPLIRSVAIVAATWWVILTGWAVWHYRGVFFSLPGLTASVSYTTMGLLAALTGASAGLSFVVIRQIVARMQRARDLRAEGRIGMLCSLGGMPIGTHSALQAVPGSIPAWFVQEAQWGATVLGWIRANAEQHPQHAQAMATLVRVLCAYRSLPASHVPGGHGGKTLLDHTMRVAARMIQEAATFRYEGLVTKYGTEPWGDPAYTFDPADPLIPLIGIAHDIGKLATFQVQSDGSIVAAPKHDLVGSRMLATLEEIKALPVADQAALHLAVSHYHHPASFPLNMQGRIGNDRAVALMMLLIRCDKWAGKEEAGLALTPDQYAAYLRYVRELGEDLSTEEEQVIEDAKRRQAAGGASGSVAGRGGSAPTITDEKMAAVLVKILTNPVAVVTAMPKGNVAPLGQVCNTSYPEWVWEQMDTGVPLSPDQQQMVASYVHRLVVVHEQRLRQALVKALGLSEVSKLGDGRAAVTVHALRVLHDMGVLYTDAQGGHVSPESALYRVALVRNDNGREIAQWTAILLRPRDALEGLAKGGVHPSLVKILRPMWADRLQRQSPVADASGTEEGVASSAGETGPSQSPEYAMDREVLCDEIDAEAQAQDDLVAAQASPISEAGQGLEHDEAPMGAVAPLDVPVPVPVEAPVEVPAPVPAEAVVEPMPSSLRNEVPVVLADELPPPLPGETVWTTPGGRPLATASQADAATAMLMAAAAPAPVVAPSAVPAVGSHDPPPGHPPESIPATPGDRAAAFRKQMKQRRGNLADRSRWGGQGESRD